MAGQHQRGQYNMTEEMAELLSVWHMKIKVGPLLHGGDLWVSKFSTHDTYVT